MDGWMGKRLQRRRGLLTLLDRKQYNFRMNALMGNIPGVKKASW